MEPVLSYVGGHGGQVYSIEKFDVDFLSILSVEVVYRNELGYKDVNHIYVLGPG